MHFSSNVHVYTLAQTNKQTNKNVGMQRYIHIYSSCSDLI